MDNNFIGLDLDALKKELENSIALKILCGLAPDKRSKKVICGYMNVFLKHGVDVQTALDIMNDLIKTMNILYLEEENENE